MSMRRRTTELAQELGLTEKHVLFGEWVPYDDWAGYLLEADVGVSLHFESVETRFAQRTRLLDYIWAGLPMVVSDGDVLSNRIRDNDLGFVVQCQNEPQVASALARLLADVDFRTRRQSAFAAVQQELTWERVAEPLIRFCRQPSKALEKNLGADFRPGLKLHELEAKVEAQEAELAGLRDLVQRYEAGRFMRLMAACAQAKASLWERKAEEGSGIQENDRRAT
jgi:hypothetical protein